MNKNTAKIKAGITSLAHKQNEIISGIVLSGSVDTSAYTITVQPSDDGQPIEGVRLNGITSDDKGMILLPAENSNVVIGSIDGPGEWALIRASEITKAIIKINAITYEMDETQVNIQNNNTVFNISDGLFKMNTASENLFSLLKDLITYITELTVPTPAGTSSIPANLADFNNLITRLSNLLTN